MGLLDTYDGPFDPDFELSKLSRTALARLGREHMLLQHIRDRAGVGILGRRFGPAGMTQVAGRPVRPGTVSGQRYRWQGLRGGQPVIEIEALWTVGAHYPAQWPKAEDGWTVVIEGEPSLRAKFMVPATFDRTRRVPVTEHAKAVTVATAMHAVNTMVPLCQAGPGVKTFLELPVITGAHFGSV